MRFFVTLKFLKGTIFLGGWYPHDHDHAAHINIRRSSYSGVVYLQKRDLEGSYPNLPYLPTAIEKKTLTTSVLTLRIDLPSPTTVEFDQLMTNVRAEETQKVLATFQQIIRDEHSIIASILRDHFKNDKMKADLLLGAEPEIYLSHCNFRWCNQNQKLSTLSADGRKFMSDFISVGQPMDRHIWAQHFAPLVKLGHRPHLSQRLLTSAISNIPDDTRVAVITAVSGLEAGAKATLPRLYAAKKMSLTSSQTKFIKDADALRSLKRIVTKVLLPFATSEGFAINEARLKDIIDLRNELVHGHEASDPNEDDALQIVGDVATVVDWLAHAEAKLDNTLPPRSVRDQMRKRIVAWKNPK